MAHFAEINENNIVTAVYVVANEELLDNGIEVEQKGIDFLKNTFNNPNGKYVQTSYNNRFRNVYASIGSVYNETRDIFIPLKPYASWVWDEQLVRWIPPVPKPEVSENIHLIWDEMTQSWFQRVMEITA